MSTRTDIPDKAVEPWHMTAVHQDEWPDDPVPASANLIARLRAENEVLKTDLAIANRGGLDLLYAIRGAIGWTDKHGLSLMPAECARLYRAAKKNAPIWPGKGYDHSQSGGFDGPTGAD